MLLQYNLYTAHGETNDSPLHCNR